MRNYCFKGAGIQITTDKLTEHNWLELVPMSQKDYHCLDISEVMSIQRCYVYDIKKLKHDITIGEFSCDYKKLQLVCDCVSALEVYIGITNKGDVWVGGLYGDGIIRGHYEN